jgi:hypothetical protein
VTPPGYAHLAVRAPRERVQQALAACGATQTYVGPTEDRWCGVVPGPATDLPALAAALSEALGAPVLFAGVGPNELELRLYVYAEEIVRYRSGDDPEAGAVAATGVERLIDATSASALPAEVSRILGEDGPEPSTRYGELAAVLGLPGYLVGAGDGREPPPGFLAAPGGVA